MPAKNQILIGSLVVTLGLFACAKASFRGAAPTGSTADAAGSSTGPGASSPNARPKNDVDLGDIGMDGKFNPDDLNDPDNPKSPNNPYNPEFKPKGPPGGKANACTVGDQINFSWKGAEKECIVDQGKTFHFDRNKCLDLNVTKFPCDWKTLVSKLEAEGIKITDKIKASMTNGSKLISCGEVRQKDKKNRIIAQWIKVEDMKTVQGCEAGGDANPNVTTGCYTKWLDRPQPPEPQTEDEKRARVYQCLDEA